MVNYIGGVKLLHQMGGFDATFMQSFEFRITMKSIARLSQLTPNSCCRILCKQTKAVVVMTLLHVIVIGDIVMSPHMIVIRD